MRSRASKAINNHIMSFFAQTADPAAPGTLWKIGPIICLAFDRRRMYSSTHTALITEHPTRGAR